MDLKHQQKESIMFDPLGLLCVKEQVGGEDDFENSNRL